MKYLGNNAMEPTYYTHKHSWDAPTIELQDVLIELFIIRVMKLLPSFFFKGPCFFSFNLQSPCRQTPCQNSGTCIPSYELNSYRCICAPGFAAFHCERKGWN